jgi:hypothetical protein
MTAESPSTTQKTLWHRLLGSVLEQLLSPVGILVQTDVPVMSDPPEADIILLRRESPTWTSEQLARLPDGIRHSQASHILIEFKYTESVNEDAWLQTLGYDTFYKRAKHLTATKVQTFLVSAKTPQADTLTQWGYVNTEYPGVYHTADRIFGRIILLSLNQLANEPHNACFKCFASRLPEKRKAFVTLTSSCVAFLKDKLEHLLTGLYQCWFMKQSLTAEKVIEMGNQWLEAHLARLPVAERLKGLTPQERLMGLTPQDVLSQFAPQERLMGLTPQDVLSQFAPQERLMGLKPQDVLSQYAPQDVLSQFAPQERLRGLKPQDVLSQFAPQERLKGLEPQEVFDQFDPAKIEEYLHQLKRKQTAQKKGS